LNYYFICFEMAELIFCFHHKECSNFWLNLTKRDLPDFISEIFSSGRFYKNRLVSFLIISVKFRELLLEFCYH